MNFQLLKQRLSLKNISQSIQRVLMRFPLSVCFLFALTVLTSCLIIAEKEKELREKLKVLEAEERRVDKLLLTIDEPEEEDEDE